MRPKSTVVLALLAAAIVTLAGCSTAENTNAGNANASGSAAASNSAGSATSATPAAVTPAAATTPAGAAQAGGAPIEFAFLGITADKQNFAYKIKVNTDKPISQVDLAEKEMDDSGKVLDDTTVIWQNIVKSKQQPIEKGKTYNVDSGYLYPGATKVELKLKRVVFTDGTSWNAG